MITIKKEVLGVYIEELDMTIIFEYHYDKENNMTSEEIVGFYCGEPNMEYNEMFYGKLKARFD